MSDVEIRCACGLYVDVSDVSAEQATLILSRVLNGHLCHSPSTRSARS